MRRLLAIIVVALALGAPAQAAAQQNSSDCMAGRLACIDRVIREMERRFTPLARACDHDVIFSLAYLRTTEAYRSTIAHTPDFFGDPRGMNRLAARFAGAYFFAFDAWHGGRVAAVPRAWAIAFDAADRKAVSGAGDLLLGMNAHIQRDLPFVLYEVGLRRPDGSSRKPDHDKVNRILERIYPRVIEELANRFDPTIASGLPVAERALFNVVVGWRELAWQNARRLAGAATPADRAVVARAIEEYAASQALAIRIGAAYPPGQDSAARDAHCRRHGGG